MLHRHAPLRIIREFLSLVLMVSLLTPTVAVAQPGTRSPGSSPAVPPPRADGPAPPARLGTPPTIPGPDYRLGPGDLLEVQVAGRVDVIKQQVMTDVEGAINIPPIGAIQVGGLTLLEAHRRVGERARAVLRFVDVTVAVLAPRAFEVVVSGEVDRPGAILTPATRRLHEVIQAAGGITPRGSMRHVTVSRDGREQQYDLLAFELRGDVAQNPFIEEGMRVHVPPRTGAVTLTGAVRRPGEYEVGRSGSLRELLELVGGLGQTAAAGDARLTRVGSDGRKETRSVDLRTALVPPVDVTLREGDTLFVPSLTVLQDVVEVRGAFNGTPESGKATSAGKPTIVQRFELAQGDRLRDVVARAGGAAPFADLRLAVVERTASAGPRQRIPVDLHRLLVEKDEAQNLVLENGDVVTLPVVEDKIYIVGEVRTPGAHDYRPDLTPREYVAMSGGPSARAKVAATTVTFRSGQTFRMAEAPPLEPGAVVTVPEVSVKWWQDYVQIASVVASIVTAYTGLYLLFGGSIKTSNGTSD
jgi:protein involved in polysaccharide export with SLBB domain